MLDRYNSVQKSATTGEVYNRLRRAIERAGRLSVPSPAENSYAENQGVLGELFETRRVALTYLSGLGLVQALESIDDQIRDLGGKRDIGHDCLL